MIDKETAIFRWADREGLLLKHKTLRASEILEPYGKVCVPSTRSSWGWDIVDKPAEIDTAVPLQLFSKKMLTAQRLFD